jgi:hypothetical protein
MLHEQEDGRCCTKHFDSTKHFVLPMVQEAASMQLKGLLCMQAVTVNGS